MRMRTYRITLTRIFSVTPQGHTMPVPKWFKLELAPTRLREIRTAIMLAGGNSTCSHLRSLKLLPCIPRVLPILFLSPTLRFQEMKIGRGVGPFAKMTSDEKRVIDPTVLHLRSIKFVTNAGVIGHVVEELL